MKINLQLIGFLMGVALLFGLIGYMVQSFPKAVHAETVNQRAIAAGSWKHQQGYQDYAQFVARNK